MRARIIGQASANWKLAVVRPFSHRLARERLRPRANGEGGILFRFGDEGELLSVERSRKEQGEGIHVEQNDEEALATDTAALTEDEVARVAEDASGGIVQGEELEAGSARDAAIRATSDLEGAASPDKDDSLDGIDPADVPGRSELEAMKVDELRKYARAMKVKGTSGVKLKRGDMIDLIEKAKEGKYPVYDDASVHSVGDMPSDRKTLEKATASDLRVWAKEKGVKNFSKMNKQQLVDALCSFL